jgi:hypothetical protein
VIVAIFSAYVNRCSKNHDQKARPPVRSHDSIGWTGGSLIFEALYSAYNYQILDIPLSDCKNNQREVGLGVEIAPKYQLSIPPVRSQDGGGWTGGPPGLTTLPRNVYLTGITSRCMADMADCYNSTLFHVLRSAPNSPPASAIYRVIPPLGGGLQARRPRVKKVIQSQISPWISAQIPLTSQEEPRGWR